MANLAETRRAYAESVCGAAKVAAPGVREAYATVPREHFLGPPPWTIVRPGEGSEQTADVADLYQNVLVAIDLAKGLNNGEPCFWAYLFDRLAPKKGERAAHAGAGTGYYTALLAEMVGPEGSVLGVEYEPDLAARAAANLKPWGNVRILNGDALTAIAGPFDIIVASAGLATIPRPWVEALANGGRLMLPLTVDRFEMGYEAGARRGGEGAMVLITRQGDRYRAQFAGGVGIYPCIGARRARDNAALAAAFTRKDIKREAGLPAIRALHLGAPPSGAPVWLAGEDWWISLAA